LISVDELRAAGALYVPPAWRKSLGEEARDLFSDLSDDDDPPSADHGSDATDADLDGAADGEKGDVAEWH
jgi:hypothetical protein